MKEIISKELLGEILNSQNKIVEIKGIKPKSYYSHTLYFDTLRDNGKTSKDCFVNIYELMAKAKEWALEPTKGVIGFNIHIEPISINDKIKYVSHVESRNGFTIFDGQDEILIPEYSTGIVDTMYTATFQACQWVYDNKGDSNA